MPMRSEHDLPVGVPAAMQLPSLARSRRLVQRSYRCRLHPSCAVAGARVGRPNCVRSPQIWSFQSQISSVDWGDCSSWAEILTASSSAAHPLASLGAPLTSPRFTARKSTCRAPTQGSANNIADTPSSSSRQRRNERLRARFIAGSPITSATPRPLRGLGSRPRVRLDPAPP